MKRPLTAFALIPLMLLGIATANAQFAAGTWLKRDASPGMVMIVEPAGAGMKITYKAIGPDGKIQHGASMTIDSRLDGSEAPMLIDGKPTGQTMAIRRIDPRHASAIVKFQGQVYGTSKAELSADGKVLRVENEYAANPQGHPVGQSVEHWDRR